MASHVDVYDHGGSKFYLILVFVNFYSRGRLRILPPLHSYGNQEASTAV